MSSLNIDRIKTIQNQFNEKFYKKLKYISNIYYFYLLIVSIYQLW